MTKLREIMATLKVPVFKITPVSPDLSEKDRAKVSKENANKRIEYINSVLSEFFPDVYSIFKDKKVSDDLLLLWKQTLTDPDDRIILEAARTRAIYHEQRPSEFTQLGLDDLDYFETEESINRLKSENKDIEVFLQTKEFKDLSKDNRRLKLKELFKERDSRLHDLVFILTLNVDDLPRAEIRKLNALHAVGEHDEAKAVAKDSVFALRRQAIADYRLCSENRTKLDRLKYRTFS
jgi:hypothetical protein